jgi:hypothetical protein
LVLPEQLLLAWLLQAFYGNCSERLLLEQLHYNLVFHWFVGLSPDDPIWQPTTFTKNKERLLNDDVMGHFLKKLMGHPKSNRYSASRTPQWIASCCRPGRSIPRSSGSTARTIGRHRPKALTSVMEHQCPARSGPRVTFAASSSATRPTAPVSIQTHCCAGNPMPTRHF